MSGIHLLGRLAQLPWFAANGETTATYCVGLLANGDPLRGLFATWAGSLAGRDLEAIDAVVTERRIPGVGRIDIEGQADEVPLLRIEAKFDASITVRQVRSYIEDQDQALAEAGAEGAFLLLVPRSRQGEAERVLREAERVADLSGERLSLAVGTWHGLIEAWSGKGPDQVRNDVEQLHALVSTLSGFVIEPFGSCSSGPRWADREADFARLTDLVTRSMTTGKTLSKTKDSSFLHFRYVDAGRLPGESNQTYGAVGVHPARAAGGHTPVWLRFHCRTGGFRRLARASDQVGGQVEGHLWIPLAVDPELGGASLVDHLATQARIISDRLMMLAAEDLPG